jgi:AhpD family alkylhydroperoxidase
MKNLQVFDPALCCSSGVCGVDVDEALVGFAADLDWARQQGAQIERFNLAQQPMAFAENAAVKRALECSGEAALPLIVVDGAVALSGRYPVRDELRQWLGLHDAPSIFNAQVAELVAIGAAVASHCEPCLKFHVAEAKKFGVSAADMRRAVDLAQKVKDAPARAMRDLAKRLLEPAPADAQLAAIAVAAAPDNACCSPAPAAAGPTAPGASKCC